MASVQLRKSWLLRIGSAHSLFKIPRKFSVIKKKVYFSTNHFFSTNSIFWSRCLRLGTYKLDKRRSHGQLNRQPSLRASPDNTVRPNQSNCLPPTVSRSDISFACLFYSFNKRNKLNLLVGLIFLATTRLYIIFYLLLEGFKLAVGVRDRDEGLGHRLTKDCYIDRFLNPRSGSIFMALRPCFFDRRLSAGDSLASYPWALVDRSSDCPSD